MKMTMNSNIALTTCNNMRSNKNNHPKHEKLQLQLQKSYQFN